MSASQEERERDMADVMAKLDRAEESEQSRFTDDDDDDDDLPELVTDTEDSDREDKLPELGTGNDENRPKPAPSRARPPARRHRELKPRELPTGKPPLPAKQGSDEKPRRRFKRGTVTPREVATYRFRLISPVDPSSAPAAVDNF
jgi:hypothetical protein